MLVPILFRWKYTSGAHFTFQLEYNARFVGSSLIEITRLTEAVNTTLVGCEDVDGKQYSLPSRDAVRLIDKLDLEFRLHEDKCRDLATERAWEMFWERKA